MSPGEADLSASWKRADFAQQWTIVSKQLANIQAGGKVDVFESFIHVMKYLPADREFSFLDCACALGHYYDVIKLKVANTIRYTGSDFAESAVARARERHPDATWRVQDLTALEFSDREFDIVMAAGVLEHIPAWERALLEITRVASEYIILHRLPSSKSGRFIKGVRQQYGIETARNSFAFRQIVALMEARDFAIINSLDTYGRYDIPEQTMLFARMIRD